MVAREGSNSYGELYALTVDDLLFDLNVIYINKSMYRQKTGSPKTKNATRWVNVKPYVMEMLKEHLNWQNRRFGNVSVLGRERWRRSEMC